MIEQQNLTNGEITKEDLKVRVQALLDNEYNQHPSKKKFYEIVKILNNGRWIEKDLLKEILIEYADHVEELLKDVFTIVAHTTAQSKAKSTIERSLRKTILNDVFNTLESKRVNFTEEEKGRKYGKSA